MIQPSFSLTASERVLPRLALDFTTATLDPRITFSRALNTATAINSSGAIVAVNANLPRFDYDPTTLTCKGLLVEELRTNLLLNSLLDGTSLATQSVTVTAAAHTLSFYGSGEIVLSGTHSATVTGTGAYPSRKTYTFTPTAGSLTLTVTGTVQYANLELGAFPTSFIPTDGTTKTRNPDAATMTGTNFTSWFNQPEGTLFSQASSVALTKTQRTFTIDDNTSLNSHAIFYTTDPVAVFSSRTNNVTEAFIFADGGLSANTVYKVAGAYKLNSFAISRNGAVAKSVTSGTPPSTLLSASLGSAFGGTSVYLNGHLQKIAYYPQRLLDAELRAITK